MFIVAVLVVGALENLLGSRIPGGTHPVKPELPERSSCLILLREPSEDGMAPVKELLLRSRCSKLLCLDNVEGMLPLN